MKIILILLKWCRLKFLLIQLVFSLSAQADTLFVSSIRVQDLPAGEQVKASGQKLISQPYGFTRITADTSLIQTVLHVAVHGFESEGYEWVASVSKLAQVYNHTYFYRYDWQTCPDSAAVLLSASIDSLVGLSLGTEKVVLFGHSYGGLVVTFCAALLHLNIPIEVHSIAAPLRGYSRLFKSCSLSTGPDGEVLFLPWEKGVSHFQWRTQHLLDNAFRRFKFDPQEVLFPTSTVTRLPATMDGQRLGHNWSVNWVIDEYLGIPHKP